MDLIPRAKYLLRLYKVLPKKHLGQNFVVNSSLLERIVSYASVNKEDVVLEIGAGLGFLTRLLSEKCRRVVAIEVDSRLIKILKEQLQGLQNLDLIEGDVFKVSVPQFNKVVSTPPYSISSSLLFWLLERRFDCAVMTFQKEFAERLVAPVGSKDYRRLTVTAYYWAEAELLDHVPRNMFYPPPDVDSMIVRLKPRREPPFYLESRKAFFELVQALFTQRNKKVRNAILPFLHKQGIKGENSLRLADSLTFHDERVRRLAPEDFGVLTNEVLQNFVKKIFFGDCAFYIVKNVYEPAEDTFLIAENLVVDEDDVILDMGTGCGILGVLAAKKARTVVAVDINPHAIQCAEMNARLNGVIEKMDIRRGDLFEPIKKGEKFDVIIFNAPYLPSRAGEQKTWIGRTWAGGPTGRQLINRFIDQAPSYLREGGRILLVQSTLSNIDETIQSLEGEGLRVSVLAKKKVAFETIVVVQAEHYSK